ncbi:MAG: nucleoside phosphorylase [Ferruginibacter sp.]|nr:nucleoside phosphorylase [Bacteroidota bacterium]MBX2920042.1 nucleoside phosphorylase [Ferruginibacter sp.]MCB0708451.1 nucleoside phosphorylase [Chitinophagaceae bacterium]MCC7379313.1 nucleoside phosphorylase [Chitinophagaceae bacterium]
MSRIAESELIINSRGAVYHLNCRPEELATTIITVGDPDRVAEVSKYFDKIECKNRHREFITHTGNIGNKRISCVSTGIGPDNIDIVFNELDALVNIDFETRLIKEELTSLNIIRLGTTGSLQKDIPVDSFVASTHGLGLDNLMHFYRMENNEEEKQLIQAFNTHTQLNSGKISPYINMASASLIKHFTNNYHQGITVTCPGFYGPQGRILRLGLGHPHLIDNLTNFSFGNYRITNFEMETSAIYGLGKALGHHCLSLSTIVANRISKEFTKDGSKTVENLIKQSLQVIAESSI